VDGILEHENGKSDYILFTAVRHEMCVLLKVKASFITSISSVEIVFAAR
jgi:hypothetical protein